MLRNTFLHIQGIGEVTERKVWDSGIYTWHDFIERDPISCPVRGRHREHIVQELLRSEQNFTAGDWKYFDQCMPSAQKWRAFGDLADQALYVDIETSGMGEGSQITMIGAYDGYNAMSFVEGINLEKAAEELERHPLIVTFNGAQFDLPIIRQHFKYNSFNFIHIDLRFPLRRLGYRGGLKNIERTLGIERSEPTRGLDGWDAVRLWREYEEGQREALDLLTAYNRDDVLNLKTLMEFVYRENRRVMPTSTALSA